MAELTFRSAGVSTREIDLSGPTVTGPQGIPAGVIGTSVGGPAFVPVTFANFSEFVSVFGETDGEKFGPLAVNEWLKNARGRINLNFIGKFENLQEDFNKLCDKMGKKRVKLLEAKKLNKRPHYSRFYDDESISIIERLYKDDIKRFDYEYEEAPVQSL